MSMVLKSNDIKYKLKSVFFPHHSDFWSLPLEILRLSCVFFLALFKTGTNLKQTNGQKFQRNKHAQIYTVLHFSFLA